MWPFPLLFLKMKDLLLQNKKLMWAQEEKIQILMAIHASLPVIAEEVALLQVAGVPEPDATIITGAATSSVEKPRTSTGGITPQGPRIIGDLSLTPHHITSDFLHLLVLPADCLSASIWDLAFNTGTESDSSNGSCREPSKVHPPPLDFQDMSHNPSLRVACRDLVLMTQLFTAQLPTAEGDWRCLANFIQG